MRWIIGNIELCTQCKCYLWGTHSQYSEKIKIETFYNLHSNDPINYTYILNIGNSLNYHHHQVQHFTLISKGYMIRRSNILNTCLPFIETLLLSIVTVNISINELCFLISWRPSIDIGKNFIKGYISTS